MRYIKRYSTILIVLFTLCINLCYAQRSVMFKLKKAESGHYILPLKFNDTIKADALLESGIHALLVDSAFAFNNQKELGINFSACSKKMNLGGRIYRISHTADTTLLLNDGVVYKGEVMALVDFDRPYQVAVPIQNLYHANGRRILKLDLSQSQLQILDDNTVADNQWTALRMNTETYLKMPAIESELTFQGEDYNASLKGIFNIDLGNPMLLFLFEQHQAVKNFFQQNPKIQLLNGYDRKGNVIAQAFNPEALIIADFKFANPTIAITKSLPKFTTEGSIGLKFFLHTAILFDFDKGVCYLPKNEKLSPQP